MLQKNVFELRYFCITPFMNSVRSGHEGDDIILSGAGPSIFGVMGYGDEILEPPEAGVFSRTNNNQTSGLPSPPTTCFSPLASSSSPAVSGRSKNERVNETSLESSFFSPYSTALSVTIAIGKCPIFYAYTWTILCVGIKSLICSKYREKYCWNCFNK